MNISTHICSKCGVEKPSDRFQPYKGRPNGQCRDCKTAAMKARRASLGVPIKKLSCIEGDEKLCLGCDSMKALSSFSPSARGLGGVSAYCRECFVKRFRPTKAEARANTAAYRKRHRARHLAAHRVRMWERRTKQKVQSDGTATPEFLEKLYATAECFYCGRDTPEDDRTADHRVPLSKEGLHSAGNLVMACWGCNCAKRDMDEHDFRRKFNDDRSQGYRGQRIGNGCPIDHAATEVPQVHPA